MFQKMMNSNLAARRSDKEGKTRQAAWGTRPPFSTILYTTTVAIELCHWTVSLNCHWTVPLVMFTVSSVPSLLLLYTIMYCTNASFRHNWHWTVPLLIFTILPVPSITSSNVTTRYHGCFQTLLFELYRLYQYWYQFKWQCWHLSFFSHIFPTVLPVVPSIYCITRVAQMIQCKNHLWW